MLKAQAMIVARQHGMSLSAFIRYLLTIQVAKAGMTEAEVVNVR
jgi:hypothetical protein